MLPPSLDMLGTLARPLSGDGGEATAPAAAQASVQSGSLLIPRALTLAFGALVVLAPTMTSTSTTGVDAGNSLRQICYLLLLVLTLAWAAPWRRGWGSIGLPWPLLLALAWCWLSLTWAVDSGIGERRLLLTSCVIWVGYMLAHNAGYAATIANLRILLVLTLVANYAAVLLAPETGIHLSADAFMSTALIGDWRGIMAHKNFAGASCALCILLFLLDGKAIATWLRIAVILAAGFFLYKTESKTSAGMVGIAAIIGLAFNVLKRQRRLYLIPLAMVVMCAFWGFTSAYQEVLMQSYLDPTSFTGRGTIWSMLLLYSQDHLLSGAGFGSFWNIGDASPVYTYGKGYVSLVTVGHNGYLDLLVTIGLPGLILVVIAMIVWPLIQILVSLRIGVEQAGLLSAVLCFCTGHNVTETSLFDRDALVGVFMVFVAAFAQYAGARTAKAPRGDAGRRASGDRLMAQMRRQR